MTFNPFYPSSSLFGCHLQKLLLREYPLLHEQPGIKITASGKEKTSQKIL